MTEKRPTVWDLKRQAQKKYPDESYAWHLRYAKMASRIIGWEKRYSGFLGSHKLDVVLLFVNEEDIVTRSPAKKQAIQDWRDEGELAYQPEKVQAPAPAPTEDGMD